MDAKIRWWKSEDKQGIHTISMFLHQAINYQEKIVILQ